MLFFVSCALRTPTSNSNTADQSVLVFSIPNPSSGTRSISIYPSLDSVVDDVTRKRITAADEVAVLEGEEQKTEYLKVITAINK